jgi:hypothetical protein
MVERGWWLVNVMDWMISNVSVKPEDESWEARGGAGKELRYLLSNH